MTVRRSLLSLMQRAAEAMITVLRAQVWGVLLVAVASPYPNMVPFVLLGRLVLVAFLRRRA